MMVWPKTWSRGEPQPRSPDNQTIGALPAAGIARMAVRFRNDIFDDEENHLTLVSALKDAGIPVPRSVYEESELTEEDIGCRHERADPHARHCDCHNSPGIMMT
jgi:hypothetical protein